MGYFCIVTLLLCEFFRIQKYFRQQDDYQWFIRWDRSQVYPQYTCSYNSYNIISYYKCSQLQALGLDNIQTGIAMAYAMV